MPNAIPHLTLSLGQMARALNYGVPPSKATLNQLRYLRLVGIPIAQEEGQGSGNRLTYDFDALIETGVALFAMERGMKAKEMAEYLIDKRSWIKREARRIFRSLPETWMEEKWLKSQGRELVMRSDEIYMRVHDRHSQEAGKMDMIGMDEIVRAGRAKIMIGDLVERFADGSKRYLLPLTRLIQMWVYWALQAPPTAPGRPAGKRAESA